MEHSCKDEPSTAVRPQSFKWCLQSYQHRSSRVLKCGMVSRKSFSSGMGWKRTTGINFSILRAYFKKIMKTQCKDNEVGTSFFFSIGGNCRGDPKYINLRQQRDLRNARWLSLAPEMGSTNILKLCLVREKFDKKVGQRLFENCKRYFRSLFHFWKEMHEFMYYLMVVIHSQIATVRSFVQ